MEYYNKDINIKEIKKRNTIIDIKKTLNFINGKGPFGSNWFFIREKQNDSLKIDTTKDTIQLSGNSFNSIQSGIKISIYNDFENFLKYRQLLKTKEIIVKHNEQMFILENKMFNFESIEKINKQIMILRNKTCNSFNGNKHFNVINEILDVKYDYNSIFHKCYSLYTKEEIIPLFFNQFDSSSPFHIKFIESPLECFFEVSWNYNKKKVIEKIGIDEIRHYLAWHL